MAEAIISLKNVSKEYRNVKVLKDINLMLEKGKVYGLIGKNGAGKTTMMRIIAGLAFASSGKVEVNVSKCGALIESPSLNENMSAKQNLKFYRMLWGETQKEKISDDSILSMVGLEDTDKRKVKDFSLGMRQRLGIAIALLSEPDFVMLDEPVNGLDPTGVVEIRNLIRRLNEEQGLTILISSHNLSELYKTVEEIIIVDQGSIKKKITQKDLEKEADGNLEKYFLSVIKQK